MTLTWKGAQTGSSSSSPTTIVIPTPVVGDKLLCVAVGGNNGATMAGVGTGWSDVVAATAMGTGNVWIGQRVLTSADVTAGSVQVSSSTAQQVVGCVILYSGSDGYGTPGTITKRTGSSTSTTALAAGVNGQDVLVVQCEKSTNNPGPPSMTVSPSTGNYGNRFPNGTSLPSVWVGMYVVSGAPADRTFTNPVASANALGVQIPVLTTGFVPPPSIGVKLWDGAVEQPVSLSGIWDGTAIQPVSIDSVV